MNKKLPILPTLSEHQIRSSIIDLLRYQGFMVWTNNSGGMSGTYTNKYGITKKRFTRFGGILGASDIFAIQPGTGKFIAIEVKRPETRNDATRWQMDFINEVNRHGGIGFVAASLEEVAEVLGIKLLL